MFPTFNKHSLHIRYDLCKVCQEHAYNIENWSYLCKIIKQNVFTKLSNTEYLKFKWFGNTVVFWKINGTLYKTAY